MYRHINRGTCSREIHYDIVDNVITELRIIGGCTGNTQGLSRLALYRDVDDVIELLEGIQCRGGTSCPDQLAKALIEYKEGKAKQI